MFPQAVGDSDAGGATGGSAGGGGKGIVSVTVLLVLDTLCESNSAVIAKNTLAPGVPPEQSIEQLVLPSVIQYT